MMGEKIPVTGLGLHDASLVWLVELALGMTEAALLRIGTCDVLRALHHHVPPSVREFAVEVIVGVANLEELVGFALRASLITTPESGMMSRPSGVSL